MSSSERVIFALMPALLILQANSTSQRKRYAFNPTLLNLALLVTINVWVLGVALSIIAVLRYRRLLVWMAVAGAIFPILPQMQG